MAAESPSSMIDDTDTDDEDDLSHVALAERLKKMQMYSITDRFFGRSSLFSFAQQAVEVRNEANGTPNPCAFLRNRRPYFWNMRDWETEFVHKTSPPVYVFPEPDLLDSLIALFFERVHPLYPAVHRQTFERGVRDKTHLSDPQFGKVVMTLCALASRYSNDPRVFFDKNHAQGDEGSSAGWKYIVQVPFWEPSLYDRTSMHDLQFFALAAMYFVGSSMPQASFHIVGLAIRLAQERGLHRRKGRVRPTIEELTETRTFWCLIATDRLVSSFLGRTAALHDEDIDCDYPIECDDEYWETEDPEDAFKQPEGKPPLGSFTTYHLKLCEIIGFMTRTLYSTKKSQILSGLIGPEWETRVVTELDSSLNKWKDALPQHLVWDPLNPHPQFYIQSLVLHCTFQYLQIQVHRPFLSRKDSLALSSLAICANAARACSHAAASCVKRQLGVFPNVTMATFLSAMVLTVHFWSSRQSKVTYDLEKEIADIERCRDFMAVAEKRWYVAGRLRDMITEFSLRGGSAFAQAVAAVPSNKRSRQGGTAQPTYIQQLSQIASPASNSGSATPSTAIQTPPYGSQYSPASSASTMYSGARQFAQPYATTQAQNPSYSSGGQPMQPLQQVCQTSDVDLSSLMLAQMGYFQSPGNNFNPMAFSPQQHLHSPEPAAFPQFAEPVGAFDHLFPLGPSPAAALGGTAFGGTGGAMGPTATMGQQQPAMGEIDPYDMSVWMSNPQAFSTEFWETYFAGNPVEQGGAGNTH
ncbi:hypothetical protein EST38_g4459 [Candolleomyces aberdarensis]|uniref:Xylanolytic transcriptional activator regulatory domain-containing protein n=1 Tax=Candolleomyces aberdarensis TaxID=2316362 RepID=A0A4Q2DN40_9AGAR|nr:hypothetical protein EST38_g4459 [Candolleomyces aberdarensis]